VKKIKIGDKELGLRASPLALFYYQTEFNKDLMSDLMSLQSMAEINENDFSDFDSVKLLQIIYAMNRANNYGKEFPTFVAWLNGLEYMDLSDPEFILDAMDEAMDGFFRSLNGEYQKKAEEIKDKVSKSKSEKG